MRLIDLLMIIDSETHISVFDTDEWQEIYHGLCGFNNNNKIFSMNSLAKKVCVVKIKNDNGVPTITINISYRI